MKYPSYDTLATLCRDKKLDFEFPCSAKRHKKIVLGLMDFPIRMMIGDVEWYIGEKYQYLMYNPKTKIGEANFNDKDMWKRIKGSM